MNLLVKIFAVLLLISLMVFFFFGSMAYQYEKQRYIDATKQRLEMSASVQKSRVIDYVHSMKKTIDTIAGAITLEYEKLLKRDTNKEVEQNEVTKVLQEILLSIGDIKAISVVSMQGRIVASTDSQTVGLLQKNFPKSFEEMQRYVISESINDSDSQNKTILSRGPLFHGDTLIGLIYLESYNVGLTRIVSDYTGFGKTGETVIANFQNDSIVFLAQMRFPEKFQHTNIDFQKSANSPMHKALKGEETFLEDLKDYRNHAVFAYTGFIPEVNWGLVVKIDQDELLEGFGAFRTEIVLMFFLILPLIVLITFLFAKNLAKPILELTQIAQEYSNGNFSRRANINYNNEIGMLAKAFNNMVYALTSSHKRLIEAQNISNMGSLEYNVQKNELTWSDEVFRIFEIEHMEKKGTFELFLSFVHEDDREMVQNQFSQSMKQRQKYHIIHKIRTQKGNIKVIEATAVHEYEGEMPVRSIGAVLDITEAKTQEKQLQELLRLANSHIIMSTTDIRGNITYASEAFCQISGFELSELMGKNHRIVRHPDMPKELYEDMWDHLSQNKPWQGEIKNRKKDGGYYWVYASISPIYDLVGNKIGYTAIRDDITDQKIIEETQRIALVGSYEIDIASGIMKCSEQALRILGLKQDNNILTKQYFLGLLEDKNRNNIQDIIFTPKSRQKSFDFEIKINTTYHGEKYLHMIGEIEFNLSNKPIKVFGSLQDITMQKMISDEIIAAKALAEQAAEIKSQFVANMSHEIRTPMNSILGFIEIVLNSASLDKQSKNYLEKSRNSANMLLGIINDILDFSKIDSKKMKLEEIPFNLKHLIVETYEMVEYQAKAKGLDLKLHFEEENELCFMGDPLRLKQVVVNLVNNAVKFTEKGSVEIHVETDAYTENVVIAINDTGVGMTPEQLEMIFKPFAQADTSTVRRFGGTGLGTVISQNLVSLMDGTIEVDSQHGVGSSFIVSLPLKKVECTLVENFKNANEIKPIDELRVFNILLAEDIDLNAELVEINLGGIGHKIKWVQNGVMVLEELEKNPDLYDLILMDVHMPQMDGIQATKEIRKLELVSKKHIPIIALTASVTISEQSSMFNSGMDSFASKPLELKKLTMEMERLVPPGRGTIVASKDKKTMSKTTSEIDSLKEFFDVEFGLSLWQSEEKYIQALRHFAKNHRNDAQHIQEALDRKDYNEAIRLAHTLKGLTHGSKELTLESEKVHQKIIDNDSEIDLDALQKILDKVVNVIDSLQMQPQKSTQKHTKEELKVDIEKLLDMLDSGAVDDSFSNIVTDNLKSYIDENEYDQLVESIDSYNYENAVELLQKISNKI